MPHKVGVTVFIGSTSTPVAPEGHGLLGLVCGLMARLSLVLLDPDIEMNPHAFAVDWLALERCSPQLVAIYNTNLPGGGGWVKERLLHVDSHVVVADGHNDG
jgi:hypothetical protein